MATQLICFIYYDNVMPCERACACKCVWEKEGLVGGTSFVAKKLTVGGREGEG